MPNLQSAPSVVVVAGFAVLTGAGFVHRVEGQRRHVAERWQATIGVVDRIEQRLDGELRLSRPALWGETTDERADPHYDRAFALAEAIDRHRARELRRATSPEERLERTVLIADAGPLLEALQRGAHARDASHPVDWSLGFTVPMRKMMTSRTIMHVAEACAAQAFDEGRPLEGVNVLLDALQFAGDLSEGPLIIDSMAGLALLAPDLLVDGLAEGFLADLPSEADQRLAGGLGLLDARLDWSSHVIEPEVVVMVRGVQMLLDAEEKSPSEIHDDDLVALKLSIAEHVEFLTQLNADFEAAFDAEPRQTLAHLDDIALRTGPDENGLAAMVVPSLQSPVRARLCSLGRFRLLVHALSGDAAPSDPWLRTFLRVEQSATGERLTLDHEVFGRLNWLARQTQQ